jgi:hypothetical protein
MKSGHIRHRERQRSDPEIEGERPWLWIATSLPLLAMTRQEQKGDP